ncbi:coniferyl aldehyde dehydrogenase [Vibrio sagamiensis]|uniref:Aldehyde dehydrogenase n=1 Tax=Vibrio sagamiensis NBRC 104589 TaxID=1219064 RepID=A0A511QCG7_9VIBR|nr:coniferyl aldehyde dehydrogenase [Vibrio sagamiensis]PNQ55059.1 coniferyl aldehyde dehydrogenase [Vibrio agarivorans]GEM74991.1 aldehyde dehydrogenase [Vibrio sagamiensis NBRC 104589]
MNAIIEVDVGKTLLQQFELLQRAFNADPYLEVEIRKEKLSILKHQLLNREKDLIQAACYDFGYRSAFDTVMADVMPAVTQINYTLKHLENWCKPSFRHAGWLLTPSKVRVEYQPLGVVGIISPWNFPTFLSLSPLITAIAAGNKAMIKLSEFTPKTNKVLIDICRQLSNDVQIVEGEADVAQAFIRLPFSHLFFTGSTNVGRIVAKAAAENLTPTTLELGGKSPVIIADDANLKKAVDSVLLGKCINAGQICVAPDYVFVPEHKLNKFTDLFLKRFSKLYLKNTQTQELTHIINQRQYERLKTLLDDAQNKGAEIHTVESRSTQGRCLYPHLVTQVSEEMMIMQDEIFGPILPLKPYTDIKHVIEYINNKPKPLALYIVSSDKLLLETIVKNTHSGGVGVNETLLHVAAEDAPFGGIGESGIGHYHAKEGFKTFSHAKTVFCSPIWLPRARMLLQWREQTMNILRKVFMR